MFCTLFFYRLGFQSGIIKKNQPRATKLYEYLVSSMILLIPQNALHFIYRSERKPRLRKTPSAKSNTSSENVDADDLMGDL